MGNKLSLFFQSRRVTQLKALELKKNSLAEKSLECILDFLKLSNKNEISGLIDEGKKKRDFFLHCAADNISTAYEIKDGVKYLKEPQDAIPFYEAKDGVKYLKELQDAIPFYEASDFLDSKILEVRIRMYLLSFNSSLSKTKEVSDKIEMIENFFKNGKKLELLGDRDMCKFYGATVHFFLSNTNFSLEKKLKQILKYAERRALYSGEFYNEVLVGVKILRVTYSFYKELVKVQNLRKIFGDNTKLKGFNDLEEALKNDKFFLITEDDFDRLEEEYKALEELYQNSKKEKIKETSYLPYIPSTIVEEIKGESLSQYKKEKENITLEPGEERRNRLNQMRKEFVSKREDVDRTIFTFVNIRKNLHTLKDLTKTEVLYLDFLYDPTFSNNFGAVMNDLFYYGHELKGKGKPEKIKDSDFYTRRITDAARVVYTVKSNNITIEGLFKDHTLYEKFIN